MKPVPDETRDSWIAAHRMPQIASGSARRFGGHILHWLAVLALLFSASVMTQPAHASKEGILAFDEFRYSAPGIGESGPIVVSGTQDRHRITALTVQAFGKTVHLTEHDLSRLSRDGSVNGIQFSYEAGYRGLGGRTVYLVLSKGFTSGRKQSQLVSVNENGQVKIDDVRIDDAVEK